MAAITFKGQAVHTTGNLPVPGSTAVDFKLVNGDLQNISLADFENKIKILSIVPSLDTGVCARSTVEFNKQAANYPNLAILTISMDLPFAQKRFCEASNIDKVYTLSAFRDKSFGDDYGILMTDGPLAGLLARAVILLDQHNVVRYTQLVPEIGQEPDYQNVMNALKVLM